MGSAKNLHLSADTVKRLEALQRDTRALSLEEVVKRALSYYSEFVQIEKKGGRIIVEDLDGSKKQLDLIK